MIDESSILKIAEEDILRILGQAKEKLSLREIELDSEASHAFLSEAIKELEGEGLISTAEEFIKLTERGKALAEDITRKHLALENYLEKTRDEKTAHQAAHILEHYVSEEVINKIRKLSALEAEGIPLMESTLNKVGLIADIISFDYGLFERIVSMGMFPGEEIVLTNRLLGGSVVVRVKNKKFALGKDIAKEIMVLEYGKS